MDLSEYIGLPWKSLGRDRSGVDCCGLVLMVLRERFGIDAPDYLFDYPDALDAPAVAAVVEREANTRWKRVEGIYSVGDVVVFRIARLQSHVGLLIGDRRFLHVKQGANSCISRLDSIAWRHRVEGFYRYREGSDAE